MKVRACFIHWISLGLMNCSNGPAIETIVVKNENFLNVAQQKEAEQQAVLIFVQSVQYDADRAQMLIEFNLVNKNNLPVEISCDLNCPENFQISQTNFKASWPVLGKKSLEQKFTIKATSGSEVSKREFSFNIPWVDKQAIPASTASPVDYSALKPENIKAGLTIAGVTGILEAKPKECDANAEVGCVATSAYKAADFTNITADKIKTGKVVAGVTGLFPSALVPLGGSSGTDLPSLSASVSAGTYQWWKQDGTRVTGSISDASTISPSNAIQNFQASVYRQFTVATDANLSAANFKSGASVFGISGNVAVKPSDCAANAEVGCVTTSSYKAADLSNLTADKIKAGVVAAGVTGQFPSVLYPLDNASGTDLPNLNASIAAGAYQWWKQDGTRVTGSINDASTITPSASAQSFSASVYRQFTVSTDANLIATNIKSGTSIFGVTGSVAVKPADCAANAEVGCVTTSSLKAADLTNLLAENIKSGVSVAGVSGLFPSVLYPLAGASGTDLPNLNANVAAGTYQWWKQDGTRATGSIADANTITPSATAQTFSTSVYRQFTVATDANLAAGNIKAGTNVFGVAGSVAIKPADCAANAEVGCVSTSSFKAADFTNLTADKIKDGVVVAGISGLYPSGLFPLAGTSGTDLPDLSATVAAGTYQWWKQDGTRVTGAISDAGTATPSATTQTFNTSVYRQFTVATDANLAAGNIKSGVSIFGVAGSLAVSPGVCTADNQSGCVTTGTYPSANPASITATDLLLGKQIAGITGSITSCAASGSTGCLANATYPSKRAAQTLFEDLFSGASVDAAKWNEVPSGGATPAVVQNGKLEIPFAADCLGTCWLWMHTTNTFDFTHSAFTVEVVQPASVSVYEGLWLMLQSYDGAGANLYKYEFGYYAGSLYFSQMNDLTGISNDISSVAYHAVNHRYWRLRHDSFSGSMLAEVSPDNTTWALLGAIPLSNVFSLARTKPEISTGLWHRTPTPSTPILDNLSIKSFF